MITTKFENFLLPEDLIFFENSPEVAIEKNRLKNNNKVYFSVTLPYSVKQSLSEKFGLDLSNITKFPMAWIKGDTPHHIDVGSCGFKNTYLVYLNDSPGEFIVNDEPYPITKNTAYVFSEGLAHKTLNTGTEPRLLLGPMNEFAHPVGDPIRIYYYSNYTDASIHDGNTIATQFTNYVLNNFPDITDPIYNTFSSWRVAYVSGFSPPPSGVYNNGFDLSTFTFSPFHVYPAIPCFLEGTTILCQVNDIDTYLPIETIKSGTLVKTSLNGYKKVESIGKGTINNPGNNERIENRLYKCSPNKYPELKEDLYITGCHSILVNNITDEQREQTIKQSGKVFVTDKKYRLLACIDERAEPWCNEGTYTIWHFALENDDVKMNYGVYANGGLLVETCSINYMKNRSNMQLIS